jgi:hypothetical protein
MVDKGAVIAGTYEGRNAQTYCGETQKAVRRDKPGDHSKEHQSGVLPLVVPDQNVPYTGQEDRRQLPKYESPKQFQVSLTLEWSETVNRSPTFLNKS